MRKLKVHDSAFEIPFIKTALLKANKVGNSVLDGFCRMIKSSHISVLGRSEMAELVRQAETLLEESRKFAVMLDAGLRTKALGMLDVRVVLFLLDMVAVLGPDDVKLCTSLVAIAEAFASYDVPLQRLMTYIQKD